MAEPGRESLSRGADEETEVEIDPGRPFGMIGSPKMSFGMRGLVEDDSIVWSGLVGDRVAVRWKR